MPGRTFLLSLLSLAISAAITLFAILSIWELSVAEVYVTLLGQLTMMVYGAYFVGRSVEKVIDMKRVEK